MPPVVMRDYRGEHLLSVGGRTVSEGRCEIHLDDAFLLIKGTRTNRIGYEEVETVRLLGRAVEIGLHPEGKIQIAGMDGALVRPLFLHLSRLRGVRWVQLLRFSEGDPVDSLECKLRLDGGAEQEALFQMYPTGLVGLPLGGEPFQMGVQDLSAVKMTEDYRLVCAAPEATAVLYGCEPGDLGRFHRSVEAARRKAEEETANLLSEVFPALEFAQSAALTALLLRGKAAAKADLDAVAPWLWERIEEVIATSKKTGESYAYLRKRAGVHLWFGLRRLTESEKRAEEQRPEAPPEEAPAEPPAEDEPAEPEKPEVQRDYLVWFMAGLKAGAKRFLAVEVVSGTKGFATYVYRCPSGGSDAEAFADTAAAVSKAMVALNFYREPLYAPQKDVETGRFAEYKLAVRKLPYLRAARERFAGRVIHTTAAAWQKGLEKLLV